MVETIPEVNARESGPYDPHQAQQPVLDYDALAGSSEGNAAANKLSNRLSLTQREAS